MSLVERFSLIRIFCLFITATGKEAAAGRDSCTEEEEKRGRVEASSAATTTPGRRERGREGRRKRGHEGSRDATGRAAAAAWRKRRRF